VNTLLFGFLFCLAALGWFLVCWYAVEYGWRIYRALRTAKYRWLTGGVNWTIGFTHVRLIYGGQSIFFSFGRKALILDWPVKKTNE